jgi:hypothetical protein
MGLSWDYEDVDCLVARLSPPVSPQEAERALRRVFRGFGRELYRERHESQPAKQTRQELEALRKALNGLSPRAANVLCDAVDDQPFLPFPYEQAQAVINPCRVGVPAARLSGALRLRAFRLALDNALEDMPRRRSGHPGKVKDATRRAIHVLCLVYCHCHRAPHPTWDFCAEEVRNPESLKFAFSCLRAWDTPDIDDLAPGDVIRSLHNYSGRNSPQ